MKGEKESECLGEDSRRRRSYIYRLLGDVGIRGFSGGKEASRHLHKSNKKDVALRRSDNHVLRSDMRPVLAGHCQDATWQCCPACTAPANCFYPNGISNEHPDSRGTNRGMCGEEYTMLKCVQYAMIPQAHNKVTSRADNSRSMHFIFTLMKSPWI